MGAAHAVAERLGGHAAVGVVGERGRSRDAVFRDGGAERAACGIVGVVGGAVQHHAAERGERLALGCEQPSRIEAAGDALISAPHRAAGYLAPLVVVIVRRDAAGHEIALACEQRRHGLHERGHREAVRLVGGGNERVVVEIRRMQQRRGLGGAPRRAAERVASECFGAIVARHGQTVAQRREFGIGQRRDGLEHVAAVTVVEMHRPLPEAIAGECSATTRPARL